MSQLNEKNNIYSKDRHHKNEPNEYSGMEEFSEWNEKIAI